MTTPTTREIYDANAGSWSREERLLLSDFTARPRVIRELEPQGKHVLDLGCGEGYVARLALEAGAASVHGVDSSSEMIARAQKAAIGSPHAQRMTFEADDATRLAQVPRSAYERIMAVFLFNYLTEDEMLGVLRFVRWRLAEGGRFVFTVPHPNFPFMRRPAPPFYFDTAGQSYLGGVDKTFEGRIWRRDGVDVPVRCVHKVWSDYFGALADAGFRKIPKVVELGVSDEDIAIDPVFFEPLRGYPLHVLFRVEVP